MFLKKRFYFSVPVMGGGHFSFTYLTSYYLNCFQKFTSCSNLTELINFNKFRVDSFGFSWQTMISITSTTFFFYNKHYTFFFLFLLHWLTLQNNVESNVGSQHTYLVSDLNESVLVQWFSIRDENENLLGSLGFNLLNLHL